MIGYDASSCQNLERALHLEWLETNGLGGYASSTIVGLNTRRYHGLLVAASHPPTGRAVLLAKLEETLVVGDRMYPLSANQYPGTIHPEGYSRLVNFRLDPHPIFTYEVEGLVIEKSLFMVRGANTTVVQYTLAGTSGALAAAGDVRLVVRPLAALRNHHALGNDDESHRPEVELRESLVTLRSPDASIPPLHLAHDAAETDGEAYWFHNFEYREDQARGYDYTEDLFSPIALTFDLVANPHATLIASTEEHDPKRGGELLVAETSRRAALLSASRHDHELARMLTLSSDAYLVARNDHRTVVAGYHWFEDWGRDTMISLAGLTLATGRYDVARDILLGYAHTLDRGLLPNRFSESDEAPEYNSVDAALWYVEAVRAYLAATGDDTLVREHLYPVLTDIVIWYSRGTRYGVHEAADGLLEAGEEGVQVTWMDAKVDDWVVTPRRGKAVEIQALWFNALCTIRDLAERYGDTDGEVVYHRMSRRARSAFEPLFWNAEAGCLYDVVDGETRDASIRPNQILAVSLAHSMLSAKAARSVVAVVERELLTPYGLRSLAPGDAQYHGHYEGGPLERDAAYHQGTVWAWLIGPFVTAWLKVNDRSEESRRRALAFLEPFGEHLSEAGIGHISEIFDGDAPHTPRGCIAQAWSVAEVLRALDETLDEQGK